MLIFFQSQENGVDQIADVGVIQQRLAGAQEFESADSQPLGNSRQDGAVAWSVNETGPQDDGRQFFLVDVFSNQQFGFGFGERVAVDSAHADRFRLIRAVMVSRLVDSERADMDDSLDSAGFLDGLKQCPCSVDIDLPVFLNRAPVADFRGTVDESRHASRGLIERFQIVEISVNQIDAPFTQECLVAGFPHEGAGLDTELASPLTHVAADQPSGSGD